MVLNQMASKAKKLLITTEKHEIFIVRMNGHRTIRGFCSDCETEVEMLTFDSAINFSGIGGRELIGKVWIGEIHVIETTNGHLLVCKNSLRFFAKQAEIARRKNE